MLTVLRIAVTIVVVVVVGVELSRLHIQVHVIFVLPVLKQNVIPNTRHVLDSVPVKLKKPQSHMSTDCCIQCCLYQMHR
jgi:hypothetical protein